MITVSNFVQTMTTRWVTTLGNVPTDNLASVWSAMGTTFNEQIAATAEGRTAGWRVLKPETGTGKTQGLCVYCSMLPVEKHPGVLIVVRLIKHAKDIVRDINEMAGTTVAATHHHQAKLTTDEMANTPVLVLTHAAYRLSVDALREGGQKYMSAWERYTTWSGGHRLLTVVDESLDLVEDSQVSEYDLNLLLTHIPNRLKREHPEEVQSILAVQRLLNAAAEVTKGGAAELIMNDGNQSIDVSLDPLKLAVKAVRFDREFFNTTNVDLDRSVRAKVTKSLDAVQDILNQWAYFSRTSSRTSSDTVGTMNTARHLLPPVDNAVVLDATASSNRVYEVLGPTKVTIEMTPPCRYYDRVKLHVAMGHRVGKRHLASTRAKIAPSLFANLKDQLPPNRSVLIICHKDVEPAFAKFTDAYFEKFTTAHWGALDGENDWQNYDTVVIFGLPYLPRTRSPNVFFALTELQGNDWFTNPSNRVYRNYKDIRKALDDSHIVVSVVQAINRARCRRVVDTDGGCAPVDVFLALPKSDAGKDILNGIVTEMRRVKLMTWDINTAKSSKGSNYEAMLATFIRNMGQGKWSANAVQRELNIGSQTTWKRLVSSLKDPLSPLAVALETSGVSYNVEQHGKVRRAYFVKEETQ